MPLPILKIFFCLLALSPLLCSAEAIIIPQGREPSFEPWQRASKSAALEVVLKEYLATTKDNDAAKKTFSKLYQQLIDQTKNSWSINWTPLANDARDLLKQGVTDPLASSELGQILMQVLKTNNGDDTLIENAYGLAMNSLILPEYSHHSIMRLSYAQAKLLHYKNTENTLEDIEYCKDDVLHWLCETAFEKDQLRYVYRKFYSTNEFDYLQDKKNINILKEHLETVEQYKGQIDPWLYHMLKGKLLSTIGWHTRGYGYANTVKDKDFKEFHKHLKLAADEYIQAYTINPHFPESALEMVSIAGASRTDLSIEEWVNRVLESEWDNHQLYSRYLNFLKPRWGGSHREMLRIGALAAQSQRYDTGLPMAYFSAVRSVINDTSNYKALLKGPVISQLRDILSGYETYNKQQKDPDRFLQDLAAARLYALYLLMENYSAAYKLFLEYGERLNQEEAFKHFRNTMTMERSVQKCFVLGSGQASEASRTIFKALDWAPYVKNGSTPKHSLPEVHALIELAKQELDRSPPEIEACFLQQSLQLLQMEQDFHAGGWVPLTFSENLPLWEKYSGSFKIINKNEIHGDTYNREDQHIMSYAMFHPPYSIELKVECLKSNTRYKLLYAGMVCGKLHSNPRGMIWWADTRHKRLGTTDPHKEAPSFFRSQDKGPVTIRVDVFKGYYNIYFNGILREMIKKDNFYPGRIGLAIQDDYTMSGLVSYKDFRIKKIPYKGPKDGSDQAQLDYILDCLRHNEQYLLHYWASVHAINLGKNKLCIKHAKAGLQQLPLSNKAFHLTHALNYYQSLAYKNLGEYKNAIEHAEIALSIAKKRKKPTSLQEQLLNLSFLLSSTPDETLCDVVKSLSLAKEALAINNKDAGTWNFLAVAQAANGDFKSAIESNKKAQSLSTDETYIKALDGEIADFLQGKRYFLGTK